MVNPLLMATVLIPLPARDFDPTESAIPWRRLRQAGHDVLFATPEGRAGRCDDRVLTGRGFGPFAPLLRAREDAREAYAALENDAAFARPLSYAEIKNGSFDAILLPGGHAPGMKPYLESATLARLVAAHFRSRRPLGAICHGVLLAARSRDDEGAILEGRRATALTRAMELSAWAMTSLWLGNYYRTYPEPVQDEVTRLLGGPHLFEEGPFAVLRDSPDHWARGFVVRDGHFLSARWPGDAHRFAETLCEMIAAPSQGTEVIDDRSQAR